MIREYPQKITLVCEECDKRLYKNGLCRTHYNKIIGKDKQNKKGQNKRYYDKKKRLESERLLQNMAL